MKIKQIFDIAHEVGFVDSSPEKMLLLHAFAERIEEVSIETTTDAYNRVIEVGAKALFERAAMWHDRYWEAKNGKNEQTAARYEAVRNETEACKTVLRALEVEVIKAAKAAAIGAAPKERDRG